MGVATPPPPTPGFLPLLTVFVLSVVDEQNRHTQVHRMSSSSSIRRENSEELREAEPRE